MVHRGPYKLSEDDIEQIKVLYDGGSSSSSIGALYNVTGSRIRKLAKDNGWKRNAEVKTNESVKLEKAIILKRARAPENYGKVGNEFVRESILLDLGKGITEPVAAKRAGLRPLQLKKWRERDIEFDQRCNERIGDFIAHHELNAGDPKQSPKDSLNLLSRHPLSKQEWSPQQEDKHTIKIEHSFTREDTNVIDTDYKVVDSSKQIVDGNK